MDNTRTESEINHFENDYCKMEIKDGILYCSLHPFLEITEDIAKVLVSDRGRFIKNKPFPMLKDISNLKFITREAREYLASPEGISNIVAAAYIATTQTEKFLWELFFKINRPQIPYKLFHNKREALKWLEQFSNK